MVMVGHCPACGDEFRPDVAVCSDCGGKLTLQEEGHGSRETPVESEEEAWRTALDRLPIANLVPASAFGALDELQPAIAALAEIRLPSRVLVQNGRYLLLVTPSDLARSKEAIEATGQGMDMPEDNTFDAAAGKYANCPACETRLPDPFDGTCPECGLELSGSPSPIDVPESQ